MPDIVEKIVNFSQADVSVPTTTETVAIASGPVTVPFETARILITARCQLTLGTGTTGVTPRIRKGSGVTGAVVGDAILEAIKTAAGSTEQFTLTVSESVQDVANVEYAFTVQQTAASANGTVAQASIEVEVLNG